MSNLNDSKEKVATCIAVKPGNGKSYFLVTAIKLIKKNKK